MNTLLYNTILYVKEKFKDDCSGHDYYHTLRVYDMATLICEREGDADLHIVQIAALLHDVDDWKLFNGTIGGYSNAENFLRANGVPDGMVSFICDIISSVSFKGTDTTAPLSKEGQIVQDADRLDALGAIGIARVFAFGGNRNREIHIPDEHACHDMNSEEYAKSKSTSINHFYEKLLKLADLMNTNTAKEIAISRHNFMEQFLTEFLKEWQGLA